MSPSSRPTSRTPEEPSVPAASNPAADFEALLPALRALADQSRLRILAQLATRPTSVEDLAAHLELSAPTVSHHLKRLVEAELVSATVKGHHHLYALRPEALSALGARLGSASPSRLPPRDDADERVLATFLVDGRLKSIPAQRKKLEVVLRHLANLFEPGRRYPEREVNDVLRRLHADVATLRRELVDARLMTREAGVYWRT